MRYLLDTNVFNFLLDGQFEFDERFKDAEFYATPAQIQEIKKTKCATRRALLLAKFEEVTEYTIPTKTAVWDLSQWDSAEINDDKFYETFKDALDKLNDEKKSNDQDALIAEVAIKENMVLITSDADLLEIYQKHSQNFIKI